MRDRPMSALRRLAAAVSGLLLLLFATPATAPAAVVPAGGHTVLSILATGFTVDPALPRTDTPPCRATGPRPARRISTASDAPAPPARSRRASTTHTSSTRPDVATSGLGARAPPPASR